MKLAMNREAILKRRDVLLAQERGQQCRWFYLSFADQTGFRGGCFVLAPGFVSAIERACELGINPGGEVMGFATSKAPPREAQNRLLSKDEVERLG